MPDILPLFLAVDESHAVVAQGAPAGVVVRVLGQMELPANLHGIPGEADAPGNVRQVGSDAGNVLTLHPVAPGGRAAQLSPFIEQRGRDAVDLGLNRQCPFGFRRQTPQPFLGFAEILGLGHGEHGNPVANFGSPGVRRIGCIGGVSGIRRIGRGKSNCGEIRVFGIRGTQLIFQGVVLRIAHQRRVTVIVGFPGLFEAADQIFGAVHRRGFSRGFPRAFRRGVRGIVRRCHSPDFRVLRRLVRDAPHPGGCDRG